MALCVIALSKMCSALSGAGEISPCGKVNLIYEFLTKNCIQILIQNLVVNFKCRSMGWVRPLGRMGNTSGNVNNVHRLHHSHFIQNSQICPVNASEYLLHITFQLQENCILSDINFKNLLVLSLFNIEFYI